MGEAPISFGEIGEWARLTGRRLTAWDVETLRRLSGAWIGEKHRASKAGCKPPWKSPDAPYEASAAQLAMRAAAAEAEEEKAERPQRRKTRA